MTYFFTKKNVLCILGILMMSQFIICTGYAQRAQAQQGSLSETAYLQQLYAIMTELSQVGHDVSKNAVNLQSAPEDKCENEFGFYQGIVSALRSKLSITAPPQKLQALHVKSMEGLSDYLTGLNLYSSACVDKDYAMKAKLFDRGSSYISKADQQIAEVNSLIANPAMVPQYASSTDFVNEWCVSRLGKQHSNAGILRCYSNRSKSKTRSYTRNEPQREPGKKYNFKVHSNMDRQERSI